MKPEIFNNQRKIKITLDAFQNFTENVIKAIFKTFQKSVTIAFVSDRKMRALNKQFRGKNATTDVLSFPFEPDEFEIDKNNLGDIVVSVEQAARQAAENNLSLELEIKQLILHGILHLCGYDHETDSGAMNLIEIKLRGKLEINE